jgi:hypothetical protein
MRTVLAGFLSRRRIGLGLAIGGALASDAVDCRAAQGAGIRIGLRRAEGYGAACSFGPMRHEGAEWHVKAVCTGNGTTWNGISTWRFPAIV